MNETSPINNRTKVGQLNNSIDSYLSPVKILRHKKSKSSNHLITDIDLIRSLNEQQVL